MSNQIFPLHPTRAPGNPHAPPVLTVQLSVIHAPTTATHRHAWSANDLAAAIRAGDDEGGRAMAGLLAELGGPPTHPVIQEDPEYLLSLEAEISAAPGAPSVSLTRFWTVDLRGRAESVPQALAALRALPGVEQAWQVPHYTNPTAVSANPLIEHQIQHKAAPRGVDARAAWKRGYFGDGVGFIDLERAWHTRGHVDLPSSLLTPSASGLGAIRPLVGDNIAGAVVNECGGTATEYGEHGIRALGVVLATNNTRGGVGLAPAARPVGVASYIASSSGPYDIESEYTNLPNAIFRAGMALNVGDVLLLEVQASLEWASCVVLPVELVPDVRAAIGLVCALGRVVIEPAGNGKVLLDDVEGFDPTDTATYVDSGAIMVAACTFDTVIGANTRLDSSNHGHRVDCFGPGAQVVTTGYGRSPGAGVWTGYDEFSGTSSASAVIAGVAVLTQCAARARSGAPLAPGPLRTLLSSVYTGTRARSSDGSALDSTVGVMPDLSKVLAWI